ncbi:MAG: prepilin-type N-terminal cleavage/methylation domain-containing protein [SAR324 cluster bacterium]|nr:prepilin-type N-terminal cleavage/methylation domain-containing protein [SAR324 cluster bacterium]
MFRRNERGQRRGFTLVELLVSLLLLSLVLALVFGAFAQISGRAVELRDALTEQQELRLLTRIVADDLRSAQWLKRFYDKGVGYATGIVADTVFEDGREFTRIRFHAARPARFHRSIEPEQDPGLHELAYWVRRSQDGGDTLELMRREDFYLDDDMDDGGISVVLADRIEHFLIEFLPADAAGAVETWQTRWDAPNQTNAGRMPGAIRLTLGRTDAAGTSLRETIEINLQASLKL